MQQPVDALFDLDEGTEIRQLGNLALDNLAGYVFLRYCSNPGVFCELFDCNMITAP